MQDMQQPAANTDIGPDEPHVQGSHHDSTVAENLTTSEDGGPRSDTLLPALTHDDEGAALEHPDMQPERASVVNTRETSLDPHYPVLKHGPNLGQTCR